MPSRISTWLVPLAARRVAGGFPGEIAPPPVREPVPEEEWVVSPECYKIFSKLWDEVKRTAAIEVGVPVVSRRTGSGASFIRRALSAAYDKQLEKIELLANELTECQCELGLPGGGRFGQEKR